METGTTASFREALKMRMLFPDDFLASWQTCHAWHPAADRIWFRRVRSSGLALLERQRKLVVRFSPVPVLQ